MRAVTKIGDAMPLTETELDNLISKEKNFLKAAIPLVLREEDVKYFKEHKRWLQTGEALVDSNEKRVLLWFQFVGLRNKLAFLLFRLQVLTDELKAEFFGLPSIEEVQQAVAEASAPRAERQDEIKKQVEALRKEEDSLEVFKAVCNGMAKEKAEEELKKYENQLLAAAKGA